MNRTSARLSFTRQAGSQDHIHITLISCTNTHVYSHRNSEFLGFGSKTVVVGSVGEMRLSRWKNLITDFRIRLKATDVEKSHDVIKWINFILTVFYSAGV